MLKLNKEEIIKIIRTSRYGEINSRAAEVSFYLLLSLFPFILFTISIVVYIPIIHINRYIYLLQNIMPEAAFNIANSIIQSAIENRSISLGITSFFLTMWTSTRAVRALIRGINRSYNIQETRSFIKVFSIAMIFTIMLLFLIFSSMIFLVFGENLGHFLLESIGVDKVLINIWNIWRYLIGIGTIVVILLSLYIYTPNKKVKVRDSIPGAIVATFSWFLISYIYSYYANHYANYEVIYGSIGGIIILMTWIYLSSWAILIGSEVNAKLFYRKNVKYSTKIRRKVFKNY
ncbi:YihY/virulence factor BrkB family protein [Romboutsia ilealis]|uniref:YihY/virulence factor BrkB family protein n=1 Tax=Romboutsia faecis TaxID=2764597 RepID=A0ABR7JNF8_9FIRM|nr:YihY/virulence factor BrkB family protein [Romboutsia faecis]MBC5996466.1 YihY/virulence factor BrkB family protein [Romboutsia faecis]MRN23993.1 YihY/virulence factor BrkB family protein [Romboutsia ilealis]